MIRTGFASLLILTACEAPDSQLVPPNTIVGDAIEQSLTNQAGDVLRGKELFSSRDDGHCILCHQVDEQAACTEVRLIHNERSVSVTLR